MPIAYGKGKFLASNQIGQSCLDFFSMLDVAKRQSPTGTASGHAGHSTNPR